MRSFRALGFSLIALLAFPAPAIAQPDARAALLDGARSAADAGEHERALTLAIEAAAIEMTPSLRLFVAQQQALTGRMDEALASARTCASEARADAALRNRQQILRTCRDLVRELERGVAFITVRVAAREGLRVTVNGRELPPERWGEPHRVPPGTVIVEASAGGASIRQSIVIGAGEQSSVELGFEGAAHASAPATGLAPEWLALPLALGVAAALASIVTGTLALDRGGAHQTQSDACAAGGDPMACAAADGLRREGEDLSLAANTLWIGAAVLGAAAIVMIFFTDFDGRSRAAAWRRGEPSVLARF